MNWVSPITIVAAVALAAACGSSGGSNSGSPTPDAGGAGDDVATEAGPEASTGDAGMEAAPEPPDDGPWPAAHYPLPLMINEGGGVIAAPNIVTVTFTGNPDVAALQTFDDTFAEGTPWWKAVTAGYNIGAATAGGHYVLPDTVSNTSLDDDQGQVGLLVTNAIASGALPIPDANTVFVLYFPSTTTLTVQQGQGCSTFGAYHNTVDLPTDGGMLQVVYAVIANCPAPGSTDQSMAATTDDVSHEVIEAVTDPGIGLNLLTWDGFNNAWFRNPVAPGSPPQPAVLEVADVCQSSRTVTDAMGNVLARSWVNAAAMASTDPCQPETPGEIFYSVAVPTTTETQAGYPPSDGYIVVPRGTTATVDSVIFSEAKLPNDVQISVGTRMSGSQTLNPAIATGITASVTPTAGHNGVQVTLTIQVSSTATAGDYGNTTKVAVRAALSSTDHHDWPFIIRVK
jgi:hypothetical protein